MSSTMGNRSERRKRLSVSQLLAEHAFSRTAGAPLIKGNCVRVLKNADENYPAWLEAIRSASRSIHFESYIIHDDAVGAEFARALTESAQRGVNVRILYDWMGALGKTSRSFWKTLMRAGAEVRCFNPPRLDSPFGWLSRDHRKMLAVDGHIGFVTGLCVGQMWAGYPLRGIEGWRDTGVKVEGPAVAEIELAFAQVWAATGSPVPEDELPSVDAIPPVGDVPIRVVATMPYTAGLYRLDLLVAALAERELWLTDAYFAGTSPYVQSLRAAAMDGVDVRLLVPGGTDIPILRPLSRAGYRPLLEGGVRVFEWNGPMLHAKTAVVDRKWARVGSSNLNLASWLGNWELDVAIEDSGFAESMSQMYLEDLANSTEVVLSARQKVVRPRTERQRPRGGTGSAGRAVAGALRISNTVGAAITNRRVLGTAEAGIMFRVGLIVVGLVIVAIVWPRVVAIPVAVVGAGMALSLLLRAYELLSTRRRESAADEAERPERTATEEAAEPPEAQRARPTT
jgi:cardiolipin synthase A/B